VAAPSSTDPLKAGLCEAHRSVAADQVLAYNGVIPCTPDIKLMNTVAIAVPTTDTQLLRQVAAGDEAAFAELYDLYAPAIYNYLLRLVNEPAVAEEILQEVFLVMWQSAHRFREEAKVKTWLLRIAHHQAVSWLRRAHAALWSNEELEADEHDHIEEHLARSWQIDQIRAVLAQLTPNHRAVIELTFVQGLSYAEIAGVMNCPIGTVKSRMSYALHRLNSLLSEAEL
jgi:RNA polymerase sigma-70 factor (ECF subfamily)